jgi:hypothetical protein
MMLRRYAELMLRRYVELDEQVCSTMTMRALPTPSLICLVRTEFSCAARVKEAGA